MVKVCDAIMGSGKSSAAIRYMNEHKDNKFIYITPYLDEAKRIREGCPDLHFVEPSNKIAVYGYRKMTHTAALIAQGHNLTTTHQAFKRYTPETLDNIRKHGYTLIIDESVDTLEKFDFSAGDLEVLERGGYVSKDGDTYRRTDLEYRGRLLKDVFATLESREIVRTEDEDSNDLYFWALPEDLFLAFKDVYVLTYLFEGQKLHHFLSIYNIPYTNIGVRHTDDGYFFTDGPGDLPSYVPKLKDRIHLVDSDNLNDVGNDRTALSIGWYARHSEMTNQVKNNIGNLYRHIWADIGRDRRLWGTFQDLYGPLRGAGYSRSFLVFNARATNAYRACDHLVYAANVFMNVGERLYYRGHGIEADENMYALSVMVQWIWRSAIRDGKDIWLYIPSKRMRTLLTDWMDKLAATGGAAAQ